MGKTTPHFNQQPLSIQKVIEKIVASTQPKKIILFGSRARGDNRENSDFDIACIFSKKDGLAWSRFLVDLQEQPLTLWPIDLVDYSDLTEEYKKNIQQEGISLYE